MKETRVIMHISYIWVIPCKGICTFTAKGCQPVLMVGWHGNGGVIMVIVGFCHFVFSHLYQRMKYMIGVYRPNQSSNQSLTDRSVTNLAYHFLCLYEYDYGGGDSYDEGKLLFKHIHNSLFWAVGHKNLIHSFHYSVQSHVSGSRNCRSCLIPDSAHIQLPILAEWNNERNRPRQDYYPSSISIRKDPARYWAHFSCAVMEFI